HPVLLLPVVVQAQEQEQLLGLVVVLLAVLGVRQRVDRIELVAGDVAQVGEAAALEHDVLGVLLQLGLVDRRGLWRHGKSPFPVAPPVGHPRATGQWLQALRAAADCASPMVFSPLVARLESCCRFCVSICSSSSVYSLLPDSVCSMSLIELVSELMSSLFTSMSSVVFRPWLFSMLASVCEMIAQLLWLAWRSSASQSSGTTLMKMSLPPMSWADVIALSASDIRAACLFCACISS